MSKLFKRIGAVMLALCLLMTALPTAVLAEDLDGADGATDVSDQVVYNNQSTFYYDGNAVTFNPSCEGITEWSIDYLDSTGGMLGYAPSAIGSYTVQMSGKGTDCYANVTHKFSIVTGRIAYTAVGYSGAYDGNPHSIGLSVTTPDVTVYYLGPDDSEYAEVNPTFTDPGTYTVSYILEKANYETVTGSATVTINPATIEYSIGGFDGTDEYSVAYDGQPHAIRVNVSTPDVSVRYATDSEGPYGEDMPTFTKVGNHVVYFTLEKQHYKTEEGSVTVEITPADVSDQVVFNEKSFYTYTGSPVDFAPSFDGIKEWSYVYYDANNAPLNEAPTAVGSYSVEIYGEGASCYARITHAYSIIAAEIAYTADGYTGVYDGEAHSITVDVTTEGATVTYTASLGEPYTETNPTFTDAGEHPVWFSIEKDNYANVSGCATVTIEKADVSDQASFDGQDSYDYTGSPVEFSISCAGIDSWTYTYYEGETQLDTAPSAPGSYTVIISGEGTNHTAQVTHAYTIVQTEIPPKEELQHTASGYSGVYDGDPHSITVDVTTEGATVTYATSEDGEYTATNPAYTLPGEYTVWYKIEKESCDTVTGSATIAITPKEIEYSAGGYSGYCDGNAHSITVSVTTEGATVSYAKSEDGAYSAENPAYTEPGSYTVWFRLEKEGYETVVDSATVTIVELSKIEYCVVSYSSYYDGTEHTFDLVTTDGVTVTYSTSADGAYTATKPSFTVPGSYTVWFKLEKEGYETVTDFATVTIWELDQIAYTVNDFSGYCDGNAHSITVSVTTEGATVSYAESEDGAYSAENPAYTAPGIYTVWFKLEKENCATVIDSATVTIVELSKIEYCVVSYSSYYDGTEHTFDLVTTDGVTVTYSTSADGAYTATKPSFTVPGSYTVWFRLEKEGYETVVDFATVTIWELGQIAYTASDYSGYYDGNAHSITLDVTTTGVSVTYSESEDGAYGAENPSYTEPGAYTVYFKIEKDGYETVVDSASVTITELGRIEYTVSDYSGYYDGEEHTISLNVITEGVTVSYATYDGVYWETPIRFTDVGIYAVWFRLEKAGYETVTGFAEVTIAKPGTILYTVEGYVGYYDGQPHTISLNVLTEGVDVTYYVSGVESKTPPAFTDPGSDTVHVTLEKEGYKTVIDFATVTIKELRQIEYSVEDYFGYYDGKEHTIALNVITEGVTVSYALDKNALFSPDPYSYADAGTYTVWFRLEKAGYETVTGFAEVTIAKPGTILYTVEGYVGYYDGQPHTISLNVLTEGVDVTYFVSGVGSKTLPMFTEPGVYKVHFRLEKEGYETKLDFSSVIITPCVIEYSAKGYSGYADGKAHSIQLYVSTPDATVTYATSEGGEYSATKPSFSKVGTHTVWYRIEKEHYATVEGSEVVKLLQPKEDSIVYSVEDYIGAYDGEEHTIALDVTTPDVRASYATSESGAYGATLPTFTEPGTYTVWFKLEKSGYETSTGSATVTIEKAEQILYFMKTVLQYNISLGGRVQGDSLASLGLKHEKGDGVLSLSCADPDRIRIDGKDLTSRVIYFNVSDDEWRSGYSLTITVTAAETDHYKAATAKCTLVGSSSIKGSYIQNDGDDEESQNQETLLRTDIDLTILPVTNLDGNLLSSVSDDLRKKLMAVAGSDQIGAMAVDAVLTDTHTGEELHSTTGDLTLSLTGSLKQSYLENYKEMACVAVHIKQNSTNFLYVNTMPDSMRPAAQDVRYNPDNTPNPTGDPTIESYDFTMPTKDVTVDSLFAPTPSPTPAPTATTSDGAGVSADSSGFTMSGGAIDTSGANEDGSGVYADSSSFIMDGGNLDIATDSGNSSIIGYTGNGIGGGNSGEGSNIQISGGNVNATGSTGNGIGGGNSGEGSNIQISGGSLTVNTSPNGAQVYKTEVDLNNGSNEEQSLTSAHNDLTVVPVGSLSPNIEFIPCELTENGAVIRETSLSPFLLIYGPKEAFSKLLTVRAKDGAFIYDGEGHAVAAEPSIAEGTTLWYSLDLENWQTEAPAFTDVLWNEDGSVGSYQVYVLAENPDCDPAICSYTVTIVPAE